MARGASPGSGLARHDATRPAPGPRGPRPARRRMPMTRWFLDRSPQRGIPSVSLRRLLPDAQFVGCQDWEVSGCTADTRKLNPGQLFVAVRGERVDGHSFVGRALEEGAAGVVVERPCPEAG